MGLALGHVVAKLAGEMPDGMMFRIETTVTGKNATAVWTSPEVEGAWTYWVEGKAAPLSASHTATVQLGSGSATSGPGDAFTLAIKTFARPQLVVTGSSSGTIVPVVAVVYMKRA